MAQENGDWEELVSDGYGAHMTGQLQEAENLYRKALALATRARVSVHASFAKLLFLLGDLQAERFRYAQAETFYRRALSVYEQIPGISEVELSVTLKRISEMCWVQSKSTQASEFTRRAEEMLSPTRSYLERTFKLKTAPPAHPVG